MLASECDTRDVDLWGLRMMREQSILGGSGLGPRQLGLPSAADVGDSVRARTERGRNQRDRQGVRWMEVQSARKLDSVYLGNWNVT